MEKTLKRRSRVLVAARPLTREQITGIALLAAAFVAALMAILIPALARAETPPPAGFTPGVFEGGSELPAAGKYYFPKGWAFPPANSTAPAGEGFPQVTARVKCTVKITGGAVNLACPGLERSIKGLWKGAVGLTTWPETVAGADGPVTKLGVFAYFETVSVTGHVYHSSVADPLKGHTNEMVLQVEPNGNAEATFDVQFVHQDVAKPAAGAARPGTTPARAAPTR